MKNQFYGLLIVVAALASACGNGSNKDRTGVTIGRGNPAVSGGQTGSGTGGMNNAGQPWGQVTDPNLQQNTLGMFDSSMQLGSLNCQNCGVFFQGLVQTQMPIQQIMQTGQQVQVMPGSQMTMVVWDAMVGTPSATTPGETVKAIQFGMQLDQRSTVSAQNMMLVFTDQYGAVIYQGGISGDRFQGRVSYFNIPAGQGLDIQTALQNALQLGSFNAHICSMFRCQ